MARSYEYWTTRDGEDVSIDLTVTSFSGAKGTFSPAASDPDEYYGGCEIEWKTEDDISCMAAAEIASMEEWLINEHSEYLADHDY